MAVGYAGEHDEESLWIVQTAGSAVQIVPPDEVHYGGLAFSPDGDFLYFVGSRHGVPYGHSTLYKMPVLGGRAQRLIDEVAGRVTLSPDGKQVAFVRTAPDKHVVLQWTGIASTAEHFLMLSRSGFTLPWRGPNLRVHADLSSDVHIIRE